MPFEKKGEEKRNVLNNQLHITYCIYYLKIRQDTSQGLQSHSRPLKHQNSWVLVCFLGTFKFCMACPFEKVLL